MFFFTLNCIKGLKQNITQGASSGSLFGLYWQLYEKKMPCVLMALSNGVTERESEGMLSGSSLSSRRPMLNAALFIIIDMWKQANVHQEKNG